MHYGIGALCAYAQVKLLQILDKLSEYSAMILLYKIVHLYKVINIVIKLKSIYCYFA